MSSKEDSWDVFAIDVPRLIDRTEFYATRAGASGECREWMRAMLLSPLGKAVLSLTQEELWSLLINDCYKPKMHKMYARYYGGVTGEFALNVRKTVLPLHTVRAEFPELFEELKTGLERLCAIIPYGSVTTEVLKEYLDFDVDAAMQQRAKSNGVTNDVRWDEVGEGKAQQLLAFATGPIDAASHVETSLMQLVQQAVLKAQAKQLDREKGLKLDRTERLANSLGKLAGSVTRLNAAASENDTKVGIALFAGRRSSDRVFLILQNLFCCHHLDNYAGTSSVAAAEVIHRLSGQVGVEVNKRLRLVGTHAHEVQSATQQLLHKYDYEAARDGGSPVCVSSLLSHILFLSANGQASGCTALADTFGTKAFLAASMAADVPEELIHDMADNHGETIPPGLKVFDLIKVWRIDSGDYCEVANLILDAYEKRCAAAEAAGRPKPDSPKLMHSNLESVEEVIDTMRLPERIRPFAVGFGTLLDGFIEFELDGKTGSLSMTSVVMKVVQAQGPRHMHRDIDTNPNILCASKLGDDEGKLQVDPRLTDEQKSAVHRELESMKAEHEVDEVRVSGALARAYHMVTRKNILNPHPNTA